MKLTLIFTLLATFSVYAGTYAQSTKLNMKFQDQQIKEILGEIENQTQFSFMYDNNQVDVNRKVNLDAQGKSVAEVLDELFAGTNTTYKVIDRHIMLFKKDDPTYTYQNQTISGTVTDSNGEPMPGVTVVVKGTTRGTITDVSGNYTIDASGSDILVFSFIGMASQEIPVGEQSTINVQMKEEAVGVDEVVVVGYGSQKRSDITGSVTSVPKERLGKLPVTNLMHAIEGSTAGLNVTQNSSVPGSSGTMQIRGINSINANTSPFIVLDGIPFFGQTNDINPNDIESIEILKDASAVAIYGTRGANGVILITTKRGNKSAGAPKITYNGHVGVETMEHKLKPMSPERFVQKYADYNTQNGLAQTSVLPNASEIENYNAGITTDWLDETTQLGNIQDHNLSISGGTDHVQYYVSGSYLDEKGVVKGYQYKRTSFRSNIDAKINDYLKVGTSAFFTNNNKDGGHANFLNGMAMSPYSVPRDENGNYIIYPMAPEQLFSNPLLGLTTDQLNRSLNLTGNGYAEVTPGFAKGLKYRLNASYIMNIARTASYTGRADNDQSGTATVSNDNTSNWVIENILSYTKDFGKNHIDFTGLYSAQKVDYFRNWAQSKSFINDALSYYKMSAGVSQANDTRGNGYTLVSQMGRINYSYDSRYLLTLTARRDGYSAFGANTNKYGLFPSMALGWNIANESFMQGMDQVNQLKLRFSYGQTGNQAIDPNQTETTAATVQYPFGGTALTGVLYNTLGNVNLNWETTTASNVGVDFGFFNFRVAGTVEVYKTKTKDILLKRNLPGITGYQNVWANLGKMQNVGLDVTLKTVNISTDDFKWSTDLNFSTYKNKILDLYGDGKDDIGNRWFIGQPIHVVYNYEKTGIWQEGEDVSQTDPGAQPGDLKYKDQNGDHQITADDRVILGQSDPKWIGGMTNTFSYKNFNLSIFLQTSQGGLKSNRDLTYADEAWRRNLPADWHYWTPENKDNYWPGLAAYKNYRGYSFPEDWSYLRIKDITFSYNVPKAVLNQYKIDDLTLYVTGRNLYTFTKWFGWDPEMNYDSRGSGDWTNNYPPVRTISFGLNITL
ncbi:MAG TPA: TonB-dependent receptor [Sunxiuqinia sp.]|nr:TonB-dependent receptor [Sunxiuqinia sp.]